MLNALEATGTNSVEINDMKVQRDAIENFHLARMPSGFLVRTKRLLTFDSYKPPHFAFGVFSPAERANKLRSHSSVADCKACNARSGKSAGPELSFFSFTLVASLLSPR